MSDTKVDEEEDQYLANYDEIEEEEATEVKAEGDEKKYVWTPFVGTFVCVCSSVVFVRKNPLSHGIFRSSFLGARTLVSMPVGFPISFSRKNSCAP